jgi:methyl-accepting chemotaxis protein
MLTRIATSMAGGKGKEAVQTLAGVLRDQLGGATPAMLLAMASTEQPLADVLPALSKAFPGVPVMGTSTAGQFTRERAADGEVAVFALAGDFKVFATMATGLRAGVEKTVTEAVGGLPTEVAGFPYRTGLLLMDSFAGSGEEAALIAASLLGEDVPLAGGTAGDDLKLSQTSWVGLDGRVGPDALVTAVIFSKSRLGLGVCHGHEVLSRPLRVTRAEGPVVLEIEGRPAMTVWDELTRTSGLRGSMDIYKPGVDGQGGFFGIFEAGLANGEEFKIRAPLMSIEAGGIIFACGIPQGSVIRIMESTQEKQVESARKAARQARAMLGEAGVAGALVFDCACRKIILRERLQAAVNAIAGEVDGKPLAGFEGYGEIAMSAGDMSGFHNTTTVVLAFPDGR